MAAGQTYRYPVTLLSNQGYKGTIHLTAGTVPSDPAIGVALDKESIDLVDSSDVQLTVTTNGAAAVYRARSRCAALTPAASRTFCVCGSASARLAGFAWRQTYRIR